MSDKDAKNLDKFKEGSSLRVRILGVRNLEGVAIGTVKVITLHHVTYFFKQWYSSKGMLVAHLYYCVLIYFT